MKSIRSASRKAIIMKIIKQDIMIKIILLAIFSLCLLLFPLSAFAGVNIATSAASGAAGLAGGAWNAPGAIMDAP